MQEAAAAAKAAEDKAAQDEFDRQQRIKDSFDAQMPDEISQKVQAALQKEMVSYHRHNVCQTLPSWDLSVHTCHYMSDAAAGAAATGHVSSVCKTRSCSQETCSRAGTKGSSSWCGIDF